MRIRLLVTVSLLLALGLSSAYAQYKEIYRLDKLIKEMPEPEVLNVLATHLGVPADTLKKEKADNRLSFGELYFAHRFAKAIRAGTISLAIGVRRMYVDLAPISDPALVISTIAHTLGVREQPGMSPVEALRGALQEQKIIALNAGMTVIRLLPPLVITYDQLDLVLDALEKVLVTELVAES